MGIIRKSIYAGINEVKKELDLRINEVNKELKQLTIPYTPE